MSQSNKKKIAISTLGCKLNYSESSAIVNGMLEEDYNLVDLHESPDIVIIHTCSVTEQANQKCRQYIRKAIKLNPKSVVAVIGCYAQLEPDTIAGIKGVDYVLGTHEKFQLSEYLGLELSKKSTPIIDVSPVTNQAPFGAGYSLLCPNQENARTRAFLKIQDGCDYGCAYCTIPLARGKSRSQSLANCLNQAKQLALAGYKEVVLTGVNIAAYGEDIGCSLSELLFKLEDLDVPRIRISSIEPNLLNQELIKQIAASKKIVPHFHVPLQSGSDEVLKKMKRRYSTAFYKERLMKAIEHIPDCSIGADIIVGLPGESDEHFSATKAFSSSLPITYLHVFSYSRRKNTLADEWLLDKSLKDVPSQIKKERSKQLLELSDQKKKVFYQKYIHRNMDVLFEASFQESQDSDQLYCQGHTTNYIPVHVEVPSKKWAKENLVGNIKSVKLLNITDAFTLFAQLI